MPRLSFGGLSARKSPTPRPTARRVGRHKRRPLSRRAAPIASPMIYIFHRGGDRVILGKSGEDGVILVVVILNALIGVFQEGTRTLDGALRKSRVACELYAWWIEQSVEAATSCPVTDPAGRSDDVGADARLFETARRSRAAALTVTRCLLQTFRTRARGHVAGRANEHVYSARTSRWSGGAASWPLRSIYRVGENREPDRIRRRAEDAARAAHRAIRPLARGRGRGALRDDPCLRHVARTRVR